MSFAVRHAGSPVSVDHLSAADVTAGLLDGRWEPTDEVRDGAGDWVPLEDHPRFAAAAVETSPPPRKHHPDETRLDMNPLIDVALVLLIFFILTTTYETIRKVLDLPSSSDQAVTKPVTKSLDEIRKVMVYVQAYQENGQPVVKVEDKVIDLNDIDATLKQLVVQTKKSILLIDAAPDVDYGIVMAIMDAARGAKFSSTKFAHHAPPVQK
jgi:biopolymer transport protein ExbD